jgi:hypothetical protein
VNNAGQLVHRASERSVTFLSTSTITEGRLKVLRLVVQRTPSFFTEFLALAHFRVLKYAAELRRSEFVPIAEQATRDT